MCRPKNDERLAKMPHSRKLPWIAGTLLIATCSVLPARATDPPADLCSLLPVADVNKALGQTYDAPQKAVAPPPFANTAEGTDCNYIAKGSKLWFRAYVDPSDSEAKDLFARLKMFFRETSAVSGLGDEAYFDQGRGLHVRKGKVRFYLNLDPIGDPAKADKQLKDVANKIVARL
jgi:hypothetical protein